MSATAPRTISRTRERARESFQAVLDGGLRALYQPIVTLETGDPVAYEALARGPAGSPFESPAALFRQAEAISRTRELDRACRSAALDGALEAVLSPGALFINIEPQALSAAPRAVAAEVDQRVKGRIQVFFEVTERALTLHPAELLEAVEHLRGHGFGIALDDVGADRRSLALLPLLRPDVVKLDMSLVHGHPSRASGEVMNGVCSYAEMSGAAIVAEGIENEEHVLAAQSLGANLAQGWYFGRPRALPEGGEPNPATATLGLPARVVPGSPVDVVHSKRALRVGRKDVLLSVTRALEAQALALGEHAVVIANFQHARHFTPASRARYERLGVRAALTVALGVGMPDPPAPGVRGGDLDWDDDLSGEWDIAVLGPHFAGALVARDLGDRGPDRERRFEFVLTFERDLVIDVAAALIARVNGNDHPVSG